jgi:hypothetical protein
MIVNFAIDRQPTGIDSVCCVGQSKPFFSDFEGVSLFENPKFGSVDEVTVSPFLPILPFCLSSHL